MTNCLKLIKVIQKEPYYNQKRLDNILATTHINTLYIALADYCAEVQKIDMDKLTKGDK